MQFACTWNNNYTTHSYNNIRLRLRGGVRQPNSDRTVDFSDKNFHGMIKNKKMRGNKVKP